MYTVKQLGQNQHAHQHFRLQLSDQGTQNVNLRFFFHIVVTPRGYPLHLWHKPFESSTFCMSITHQTKNGCESRYIWKYGP